MIPFIVADVHRPVISLGKLAARDFDIYLGNTSSYTERNGITAGLVRKNHTFYFDLKVKASRELTAALAVEEVSTVPPPLSLARAGLVNPPLSDVIQPQPRRRSRRLCRWRFSRLLSQRLCPAGGCCCSRGRRLPT